MTEQPIRKLAVLLHADVVGSTALVQLDETLAHQRIQDTFRRLSEAIARHNGIAHEIRGDALVAEFSRASDAVSASLAFQAANAAHNEKLADDIRPAVRVGIAMGEVVVADNTVTGEGVVLSQRLEQLSEPGGVCIQGAAYETVPRRLPFNYENLGERELKGFDAPVRAFAVTLKAGEQIPSPASGESAKFLLDRVKRPAIAVLPFANMSGDPEQEFFADGIAEDLITALSKYHWFLVIARNSTFTYKGKAVDLAEIGDALGARYVVEGSVRRAGNRVRVTAQLIDTTTGGHIWAERYDKDLTDIFEVQDEITQAIALSVEPEIGAAERDRARNRPPENLGAWELCQRGFWHYHHMSADDMVEAHRLFSRARDLDSDFAPAHYGDAVAHNMDILHGYSEDYDASLQSAMALALKGVALDEKDPMAQAVLGRVQYYAGDHVSSVETLNRAIALSPNLAYAYYGRGFTLAMWNRPRDAIADFDMAERLSPADPLLWAFYSLRAWVYLQLGEFDDAIRWATKCAALPNSTFWPYWTLTVAHFMKGNLESARQARETLFAMQPEFSIAFVHKALRIADLDAMRPLFDKMVEAGIPEH